MSETRVFLDDDHRVVPEMEATRMIVRTIDAQGDLVAEHWFHQSPPRPEKLTAWWRGGAAIRWIGRLLSRS